MDEVKKHEDAEQDESIAVLVHPDEYKKNTNQVASVTTQSIKFIRRKTLAIRPFEIEYYPTKNCTAITYEKCFALLPMLFGILCILIVCIVFASPIPAGTRVPVGSLFFALGLGIVQVRGLKRHKFTFCFGPEKLKWQSKPGDFKIKNNAVSILLGFAREKSLLTIDAVHR